MTSSLRRFFFPGALPVALAVSAAIVAVPGQARAITENYCSFPSSLTTFTLNGDAFEAQQSVIRLSTLNALNESSSAFLTAPLSATATTSLHAYFRFSMGPTTTGGDGLTFTIQSSSLGAAALGGSGTYLGFAGPTKITPSVTVGFDTFKNVTDTNANHVGVSLNGATAWTVQAQPSFTMAGAGILNGWVDYTASTTTLAIYVATTATKPSAPVLSYNVNLFTAVGATWFVGFTSSTGATAAESNEHDVYELELSTDGVPCTCEGDSACAGITGTPACGSSGICAVCSATNASACTGATPVCNPGTDTCVGCLTNANCSGAKPICDATGHACRACATNTDCGGSTPYCDNLAGSASLGTCVSCIADSDCGGGTPRCDLTSNTCVICLGGADCGGDTPVCTSGKCVGCSSDSQCSGSTPACEVWGACGQCSASNSTQCSGATSECDNPTGTCVNCEFNSDCAGATPVCDATTHLCAPCAADTDCTNNPSGPSCVTSGMKSGACVACQLNTDCTSAAAPVCDTTSNQCVQCLGNSDCSGGTPVCNTSTNLCVGCLSTSDCTNPGTPICDASTMTCQPCANDYSSSNPGPDPCPTAALPACQSGGPLTGQCAVCSGVNGSLCLTQPTTPVCYVATGVCGCNQDADCAADSYCDTSTVASGVCTVGCRDSDAGANNCATSEYCTDSTGGVGTCKGEPCNSNTDCPAATPVCDTVAQPYSCVQCLNATDCPSGQVCNAQHCAQCAPGQTKSCTGSTPVCLASGTCGCTMDSDCGGPTSGMICDSTAHACTAGCRGSGGNGCAAGMTCSATGNTEGTCSEGTTSSAASGSVSSSGAVDGGAGGAGGGSSGRNVVIASKGCGCRVASEEESSSLAGIVGLLAAFGIGRRRRIAKTAKTVRG